MGAWNQRGDASGDRDYYGSESWRSDSGAWSPDGNWIVFLQENIWEIQVWWNGGDLDIILDLN